MAAPIRFTARSTTMPILALLLVLAAAPGAALAGEPPHADNHGGWRGGGRGGSHAATAAPRPAPQSARGRGAMPAPRPAYAPRAAAPAWHNAPPARGSGTANGARAPGYPAQPYVAAGGHAGSGAGYGGGERDYGADRGGRWNNGWNNGWRNDRRFDWVGWRGAHRDVFHPGYYYPPYGGYAYAPIGIGFMLDAAFLDERYWIEDPAVYHLPPVWGPYRWVRYYNDCLLIDIDTGQTVDVLYNVFW